jgi:pimeloyl-ACP methyl ester carboxylesterase
MMEHVVLLHGIWLGRWAMLPLARRLRRCGFEVSLYGYASVQQTLQQNADDLHRYIQGLRSEKVHLVGHSLGGRVILKLLGDYPRTPAGRVVLLGSPVRGSNIARRLTFNRAGRALLGKSMARGGLLDEADWDGSRELGVIAGTLGLGVGKLFGGLRPPHDGTVMVSETELPAATDRLLLKVSHTGLLSSAAAARQTCNFLKNGHFSIES